MISNVNTLTANAPLLHLPEHERVRLGEALQALLAHGSIIGLDPRDMDLYSWCRDNFEGLREIASLAGLTLSMEHENRIIHALPQKAALTLQLRQDTTIVLLALWYEYDTQIRENAATEVRLSVEQLNQLLAEKLLPDLKGPLSATRLEGILRQAQRFNLIRFQANVPFEQSQIEILNTLRRVIPFNDLAEWTKTAELHKSPTAAEEFSNKENDEPGD
jgi:hypothetical protein